METVNTHDAKTQLSKLLARVEKGEQIIIAKNGKPVARLIPEPTQRKRVWGKGRSTFEVPEDFNDPLPEIEQYFK